MVLKDWLPIHDILESTKSQKLTILVFSSSVFADDIALLKSAIPWVSLFEAARTVSSVPVNLHISNNKKLANSREERYSIEWKVQVKWTLFQ